jgi:hypothetical protein
MMLQSRDSSSGHSSVDVLHGDEEPAVLRAAEVDHLDDIGVVEAARGLGLALEAAHQRGVLEQRGLEQLQADGPVEREVARLVHLAHPALPDQVLDHEAAGDDPADERILALGLQVERCAADGADAGARLQRMRAAGACGHPVILARRHGLLPETIRKSHIEVTVSPTPS